MLQNFQLFYKSNSFKLLKIIIISFVCFQAIIFFLPVLDVFFPGIEAQIKEILNFVIKQIVQHTTQSSIVVLIIVFIYLLIDIFNEKSENYIKNNLSFACILTRLLIGSLAASAIPAGISLILCAFYDMSLIKDNMSGVEIYIAFAGISLISSMYFSLGEEQNRAKELGNIDDMNVKK